MVLFLIVVSGVGWTVVYADAIRSGLHERTYAVPAADAVIVATYTASDGASFRRSSGAGCFSHGAPKSF